MPGLGFGFGVLANFGVGNYAPTLVMLSLMGMDPRLCFPIMAAGGSLMGAGASVRHFAIGVENAEPPLGEGRAVAVDGRIVQIAVLGGPKATVNFAKLMVKRLHHTGSTLRPRSNADKAAMVAAIEAKVMPLLQQGRIKPLMDSTFPLEKAADAHRRMETSEHIGKIVLSV